LKDFTIWEPRPQITFLAKTMTIAPIVSADELADLFDCDRRTISNLQKAGVIKPVSRGRFDLRDASRAYARHHRAIAAQHNTKDAKEAALHALTALRDAQRGLIEDRRHREETQTVPREEHQRQVALCAFSFRAAFQDVSDIIGRRLNLGKTDWDFVEHLIDGTLVHHTGQAASRMGLPEEALGILTDTIRENYVLPEEPEHKPEPAE
jgi:phage terminase Nu1 subunit (DNA packaging protein)